MRRFTPALVGPSRVFTVSLLLALAASSPRPASAEVVRLVAPDSAFGLGSYPLSGNGRFLVGRAESGECGTWANATVQYVALYDLETSQRECVSVNDAGVAATGSMASISEDGQLVVFVSNASGLDPRCNGRGTYSHVYLRNRLTRHTECVSITDSGVPGNGTSLFPRISASGNAVVFASEANNFNRGKTAPGYDVFLVRFVNGVRQGLTPVLLGSWSDAANPDVAISADGRFLAFSSAIRLVPGDTNGKVDVFRHDLQTGETVMVNVPAGAHSGYFLPAISADGRFVAFQSATDQLGLGARSGQLYRRDLETGDLLLVSRGFTGTPANWSPYGFSMSADGRFIVFSSEASNLVANDTNAAADVFVADLSTGISRITRLSVATDGVTQANGPSRVRPSISGDASVVAFGSSATNLDPAAPYPGAYLARIPSLFARVLTGPGMGGGPHLRSLGLAGVADPSREFYAYDWSFAGGVSVALGDVDGDGVPDIVTGMGPGAGPLVRVFSGAGSMVDAMGRRVPLVLASFNAYDSRFSGGVSVAVGDVTGDGIGDIITGAGPGGGPHVRVFEVRSTSAAGPATIAPQASFFAYQPGFTGGVRVATGDLDGDGTAEILTAAGPGGGPHVQAFRLGASRVPVVVLSFFAYQPAFSGGVFVAAGDLDRDGREEIITGADAGGGPHVRVFGFDGQYAGLRERHSFFAYSPWFAGGVRVAAGDLDGDGRAEIITAPGPSAAPMVRAFRQHANGGLTELTSFNAYSAAFTGGVFVAAPR